MVGLGFLNKEEREEESLKRERGRGEDCEDPSNPKSYSKILPNLLKAERDRDREHYPPLVPCRVKFTGTAAIPFHFRVLVSKVNGGVMMYVKDHHKWRQESGFMGF
ncbi:hypothetical protein V6N12_017366 [Hibiscus sabdariffa]|uniref:Uncharacterized protein n=1 Tax=Hibiscus sabdariffa TaxID=183260 RepID=A0ABR2CFA4_9ROSI